MISCKNCGTVRYRMKKLGLCERCYELTRKIEELGHWNPNDAKTLKGYPRSLPLFPPRIITRIKANAICTHKSRLKELKLQEKWRQEPAKSIAIEYQFRWLAERVGLRNPNFLHGIASCFDSYTQKQRDTLYDILKSIEEHRPRAPFQWSIL
jgi:hypothetical protein